VNGGSLTGTDVLLYFTCATGDQCDGQIGGGFTVTGGDLHLSAMQCGQDGVPACPDPAQEPYIVIWVDRTAEQINVSQPLVDLGGNGDMTIDGHIYNWNGGIEFRGTADGGNRSINGTVLGDRVDFSGDTTYTVTWDEDFAPRIGVISLVE
jgi:hypothetical protein